MSLFIKSACFILLLVSAWLYQSNSLLLIYLSLLQACAKWGVQKEWCTPCLPPKKFCCYQIPRRMYTWWLPETYFGNPNFPPFGFFLFFHKEDIEIPFSTKKSTRILHWKFSLKNKIKWNNFFFFKCQILVAGVKKIRIPKTWIILLEFPPSPLLAVLFSFKNPYFLSAQSQT